MHYQDVREGEWITPRRRDYRMQCCDCGLVHRIDIRVRHGRVQYRVFPHRRATAAVRRRRQKVKL